MFCKVQERDDFTDSEMLGFCFRLGLGLEALASQVLEVTARGSVAIYGGLITAVVGSVRGTAGRLSYIYIYWKIVWKQEMYGR